MKSKKNEGFIALEISQDGNSRVKNSRKVGSRRESLRGFTIIELVVYIAIFAVIGTLGAMVFNYALVSKKTSGRSSEVYLQTERTMHQIVDRVHAAISINSTGNTLLNLQMASPAASTTIFSLGSSGNVQMQENQGTITTISASTLYVTALTFATTSNTILGEGGTNVSVRMRITAGYNEDGAVDANTPQYTLQTTALPL